MYKPRFMDLAAKEIVKKLNKAGYKAYYAGGWVRDFLMGHPSNDIDIATDAPPEKIVDLFPRTILVGLAFGVVIVLVDGKQFEVSTFRKDLHYHDGRRPALIEYSTPEEDALRRDFTINGMFYDPLEDKILDYVNGQHDIKSRIIRAIGNPDERFVEDRLRMIRGVRFAARFDFLIDSDTQEAIIENAPTLFPAVAMERVWQEFNKMAEAPRFDFALAELHRLQLLQVIFPALAGTGLHTIRERVSSFTRFPEECPTILYLMELFPNAPSEQLTDLCRYLKTSNQDLKLAELMVMARALVKQQQNDPKQIEEREWVYFYAHPDSQLCLEVIAAGIPSKGEAANFLDAHSKRRLALSAHIQRVQLGKPLITAALLQAHGISPGRSMGGLLKEAEKMVINHNRENAEEIIQLLKQTPLWPK